MARLKAFPHYITFFCVALGSSMAQGAETCESYFLGDTAAEVEVSEASQGGTAAQLPALASQNTSLSLPPSNEDFLSIYMGRNPEAYKTLRKLMGGTRRTSFFLTEYYLKKLANALNNTISEPGPYILNQIKNDLRLRTQNFSPSRQQLLDMGLTRKEFNRYRRIFGELLSIGSDAETLFVALFHFTNDFSMKFLVKKVKRTTVDTNSEINRKLKVGDTLYFTPDEIPEYANLSARDKVKINGIDSNGLLTLDNGWYGVGIKSIYVTWGCYGKVCVGDDVYFKGSRCTVKGVKRNSHSLFTIDCPNSSSKVWWRVRYSDLSVIGDRPEAPLPEEIETTDYSIARPYWKSVRAAFDLFRHFQSIRPQTENRIQIAQDDVIQLEDLRDDRFDQTIQITANSSPSEIAEVTNSYMERLARLRENTVTTGINVLNADTQYFDYLLELQGQIEGGSGVDRNVFTRIFGARNLLVAQSLEQVDLLKSQITQLEQLATQAKERLEFMKGLESNSSARTQSFYELQIQTIDHVLDNMASVRDSVRSLETQSSSEMFLIRSLMSALEDRSLRESGIDYLKELIKTAQ